MICNAIRKKNSAYTTTEQADVTFCCNEMAEAFKEYFIGFGEYDSCGINKTEEVCIYHCSPYPEGAVYYQMPIQFCPFCKEEIKVIVADEKENREHVKSNK